jgi:RHS repeat-associated protein
MNTRLCRYRYDALDLLTGLEPFGQEKLQRFYRHQHLVTELQGRTSHSVFQHDKQPLAEQRREGNDVASRLLATDQQRSILQTITPPVRQAYSPYGHRRVDSGLGSLLGFNGEVVDPITGHYLLGNGHRAFNPVLMRFHSPDRLSPFGRGGLNAYAYCLGDPVNFSDPTGRNPFFSRFLAAIGGLFNSIITLRPGVPFQVGMNAVASGHLLELPVRHIVGALASVTAGTTGVAGAAVGVVSTMINAINPASSALLPLTHASAGLVSTTAFSRFWSWWAARDPAVIPALKNLAEGSTASISVASRAGRQSPETIIEMGVFDSPTSLSTPRSNFPFTPSTTPRDISLDHGRQGIKRRRDGTPIIERPQLRARRIRESTSM